MTRFVLPAHGKDAHRANGPDPIPVVIHLKVRSDTQGVVAGDDAKRFVVTDDLGGTYLRSVHATVVEAGSSVVEVQVHNIDTATDLVTNALATSGTWIDNGDTTSWDSFLQHEMVTSGDPDANYVERGMVLRIDLDTSVPDALGLEVLLEFGPQIVTTT